MKGPGTEVGPKTDLEMETDPATDPDARDRGRSNNTRTERLRGTMEKWINYWRQ